MTSFTVCAWSKIEAYAQLFTALFTYISPLHLSSSCDDITMAPRKRAEYYLVVNNAETNFAYQQKLNQWTHVCMGWSSLFGTLSLHVNGSLTQSKTNFNAGTVIFGNGVLLFGQEKDNPPTCDTASISEAYKGEITQFYVWNRMLTVNEMRQAMTFAPTYDNLALDWKCVVDKSKVFGNAVFEAFDRNDFIVH